MRPCRWSASDASPAEVEPDVYEQALDDAKALTSEEHDRVVGAGGLHIIGTERHDSRRIDNQLRGRAGRQGDPGSSRFYLSLEDDLMKRFASDRVAGLMERLGLEGDVAIESRLVSKTIENAQSRVEGYNFDIRKRVVEYDDVINKQRETIYAERDKVLRNEDLSGTVMDFVSQELDVLVEQHLGPVLDDWDLEGLSRSVRQLGIDGEGADAEDLAALPSQDEIAGLLTEVAEATLKTREERYGPEIWAMVERQVLLRSIDSLWVDHLTELDDFRRGVGLRGYGGTDPLVEFKREAFKLYEELREFIRHQVASTIFRVSVQVQAPTPPPARNLPMPTPEQLAALRAASTSSNGDSGGATATTIGETEPAPALAAAGAQAATAATVGQAAVLPGLPSPARSGSIRLQHGDETEEVGASSGAPASAAKIGRNDPCWCGSGQKFKRCHGA